MLWRDLTPGWHLGDVAVTPYPQDEDHAPLLVELREARLRYAGDIADGDLILASVISTSRGPATDYFNTPYLAHPMAYDSACPCGVCCHHAAESGPVVVLSKGHPWETCDPWPADALALVIPAHRVPEAAVRAAAPQPHGRRD